MFRNRLLVVCFIATLLFGGVLIGEKQLAQAQDESQTPAPTQDSEKTIAVGSKNYSEQLILGSMAIALLESEGYTVVDKTGLGNSREIRTAIETGEIDLYFELTGSALAVYHNLPSSALPTDALASYELAKNLDAANGLVWLDSGGFNSTYAIMVTDKLSEQGIDSIDALAVYMEANDSPLSICVESDFYAREQDGLLGMQQRYEFSFKVDNIIFTDFDGVYDGLRNGDCDVAEGYSTDGRIPTWDFTVLDDSLAFFPFYNPAPVVRQEVLGQNPEIAPILNALSPLLDNETMQRLNARVDLGADGVLGNGDEATPKEVAVDFLTDVGLLKPPPIVVSSKNYSQQLILGQILIQLLQDAGYDVIDQTGIGASNAVRLALENGEIDLYFELTGSALSVYHDLPAEALPTSAQRSYELARSLDKDRGIVWLDSGEFNNTYAILTTEALAGQGVNTLDELADYLNTTDPSLSICVESDFYGREKDGLLALQERYGMAFADENVILTDFDGLYNSLRTGVCDVAEGYATDGRISAWGFTNLDDTRSFFPFYNPAPVIREEILTRTPELADLINSVMPFLDDATMRELNARVDIGEDRRFDSGDEETPAEVAESFLLVKGLLKPPPIVVSSKRFTEQLLYGQLLIHRLRDAGYEVEDKTGLGMTPSLRGAIQSDEIDIYYEYTGTALSFYHKLPSHSLPVDPIRTYELVKSLDEPNQLAWLPPAELNNTFAIMTTDRIVDLGINTLDDLATYMNQNDSPLSICVESDFYRRTPDGFTGMQEAYGFEFDSEKVILTDFDGLYDSLRAGVCDIAEGYSTDGRILSWGFTNLEDSQLFFPFYNASPVVRQEVLDVNPGLADLINPITELLDDETITRLNARVDIGVDGLFGSGDEETPDQVAKSFLVENGLIQPIAEVDSSAQASTLTDEADATKLPEKPTESDASTGTDASTETDETAVAAETATATDLTTDTTTDTVADTTVDASATSDNTAAENSSTEEQADSIIELTVESTAVSTQVQTVELTALLTPTTTVDASTEEPTTTPTEEPTSEPTVDPAVEPTANPTATEEPTVEPTESPSFETTAQRPATQATTETSEPEEQDPAEMDYTDMGDDEAIAQTESGDAAAASVARIRSDIPLIVAARKETPDQLVAQFLILLLDDLGYDVEKRIGFGDPSMLRLALKQGLIDLYPERSSIVLTDYHGLPADTLPTTASESFELVRQLDESTNIRWLDTSALQQYPLLAVSETLQSQGIESLEDLANLMNDSQPNLKICMTTPFFTERESGLYGLQLAYGFRFYTVNIVLSGNDKTFDGLRSGKCDVAYGTNTDSRIAAWTLSTLDDPLGFFPTQVIAPIGASEQLEMVDGLTEKVASLSALLDDEVMRELGSQVDFGADGEPETDDEVAVADVAAAFLCENELIITCTDG